MSLRPEPAGPLPEDTARGARAAFPQGNGYLRLREELGNVYEDQTFAPLFAVRGQSAEAPWRLALVLVLQFAENLSDRAAADAVRSRIDWKYLLGLELTDPGFDASVLSEFRARLVAGDMAAHLLDGMLARCQAAGLLKPRGRQRTDSTHVLAAIRVLNRLECVGETLRHALHSLATAAPDWLRPQLEPVWATWMERYGARFAEFRLPKGKAEREALAEAIGADGYRILEAAYAPDAPAWLRAVPAVETLRQVWVQEYYAPTASTATSSAVTAGATGDPSGGGMHQGRRIRWRANDAIPPAAQMVNSPHDPDARYSVKRDTKWTGYKAHRTEICDPDAPHLITHVETTPATTPDWHLLGPIHAGLAAKGVQGGAAQRARGRCGLRRLRCGGDQPHPAWRGRPRPGATGQLLASPRRPGL